MMNDMMTRFDLLQPADLDSALDMLSRHGADAWPLAGGYDSFDWFKNRGKQPAVVIDLEGIAELKGVRELEGGVGPGGGGGIEIGAMTTLTALEADPLIRSRYALLADAAAEVASPQIRNAGTIGGNVCQDTRCWYYRYGMTCYRAGGNTCYAGAPGAMNREHAIFGADRCVAVTPSDVAPALVALDAEMVVRSARREKVVPAAEFFMPPGVDITRMTVLGERDLLTAIRIPDRWAGADFHFEKVADRKTWDFALVSVAAAVRTSGGGERPGRHRGRPHRRRGRGVRPAPPDRRRGPGAGTAPRRGDGGDGRRTGSPGRRSPRLQPLQDSAAPEPGEAGGSGGMSAQPPKSWETDCSAD